ncbi:carbohydrate kinase [Marinilabiliaceae bacterium JC017]|nr:carbohydrate kinase [Marinilabiliaceae bacterium JC017]
MRWCLWVESKKTACYITEIGDDRVGDSIVAFLENNGVSTQFIHRYTGNSSLALAFLNQHNDAEYDFYKQYPEKRLSGEMPGVRAGDIVLFGSSFALNDEVRPQLVRFVSEARRKGALIVYDPNYRKQQGQDADALKEKIEENIRLAHIVRGSHEDFYHIYGISDPDQVYHKLKDQCDTLIITAGAGAVRGYSCGIAKIYKIPPMQTCSTIGAGDNFNAGIIAALIDLGLNGDEGYGFNEQQMDHMMASGMAFSLEVCKSFENYVPMDFCV